MEKIVGRENILAHNLAYVYGKLIINKNKGVRFVHPEKILKYKSQVRSRVYGTLYILKNTPNIFPALDSYYVSTSSLNYTLEGVRNERKTIKAYPINLPSMLTKNLIEIQNLIKKSNKSMHTVRDNLQCYVYSSLDVAEFYLKTDVGFKFSSHTPYIYPYIINYEGGNLYGME